MPISLPFISLTLLLFSAQGRSAQLEEAIARGDDAYARFDNEPALSYFLEALDHAPDDLEALWKSARSSADVGREIEGGDDRRARELYAQGERLARKAASLRPEAAQAHFVLALILGRRAQLEGGKSKVRLAEEVKLSAERAIAIDPRHDGAYHILGRWHYNVATLSWVLKPFAKLLYGGLPAASLPDAAALFAKAVALDSSKPVHHLEYARTLVALGRYSQARVHLDKCIELPPVQWEDAAHQAEALAMREEIRGKKDKKNPKSAGEWACGPRETVRVLE